MVIESERDCFERSLQELYGLETDLEEYQARFAEEAVGEELEEFFMGHGQATTDQLDRFDGLFEAVNADPTRRESEELEAIVDRRDSLVADTVDAQLTDLLTAEAGAAIERLEVSKYQTLLRLGNRLDLAADEMESLRTSKREAENAIEQLEALPLG